MNATAQIYADNSHALPSVRRKRKLYHSSTRANASPLAEHIDGRDLRGIHLSPNWPPKDVSAENREQAIRSGD